MCLFDAEEVMRSQETPMYLIVPYLANCVL